MTENLPDPLFSHALWESEMNPIWLATSLILHRNLQKYHFPTKMSVKEFEQTLNLLKTPLLSAPQLDHPTLLNAETLTPTDKEYLFEHFLCLEGFQNTLNGQAFVVDNSGRFFALINIQDHLQLHLLESQGSWESAWNTLNQIESAIGDSVEFAFSSKFGYLTSDPSICGTGLVVQAYLHLPALIHSGQLTETLSKHKEEGLKATGMEGTLEDIVGDMIVLSNTYTVGLSEENILHSVHLMAMKLMALEKTLRSHLKADPKPEIKDQVCRAYGLLMHSYQLQTKEALGALSLIKLGLHLDWIGGITDSKLNDLFFKCRRAHLLHLLGQNNPPPEETVHKRAEFLHKELQGIILKLEN